jgi:D-alanyl-D-alanine carboxypeptidase/D-alanyl-D-alanine-endopeptidase (penicillin-binding protein 4)
VARAEFARLVDSMVLAPKFRNAHWGILVVDPLSGDTLYSRNAGKLFMPASNMKLVTGAVALEKLGADYRYRTLIATPRGAGGERRFVQGDSVLTGDLVVVGSGDPTMSDQMHGNAMLPLLAIADSLAARGIRRIEGRLVSAGDAFPGSALGFGWAWDDLDYPYSAGVDELMFNESFSTITVRGGAQAGDSVTARTSPALTYPRLALDVQTVAPPSDTSRPYRPGNLSVLQDSASGLVRVTGSVVAGDSVNVSVAHRDPSAAYLAALREALVMRGITVSAPFPASPAPTYDKASLDTLVVMTSPPLRDAMPALQKPSQNQIAEALYRTLGLELRGEGSPDSGRRVVEAQLREWGADTTGFVIRDGSGLSRHNYLSPETIVRVLNAMRTNPSFQLFYDALPIAGVDGTIRSRMRDTPAQGNLRAKTGFIDRSRALSGYVTTADGRLLIFATVCNNWTVTTREVEEVQDRIGAALASFRAESGIADLQE